MISLSFLYILVGLILLWTAILTLLNKQQPRRVASAAFWGCYALVFLIGDYLPPEVVGLMVVMLAILAGFGALSSAVPQLLSADKLQQSLNRIGKKIFLPALLIPIMTVFGVLVLSQIGNDNWQLLDPKNLTLVSLGIACIIAFIAACVITRESPVQGGIESKRLLEAMGWAVLLPQLLATLGLLFNNAGVGHAIAVLTETYLAVDHKLIAAATYAIAMALFTMIMGNAFAAFPVITAGIGIPVLMLQHGANPAVVAAIGMFCGYCGTLMTPMAANFNMVPAALLELKDQHAVIKAQTPTALTLLICNIFLLYFLAF
ncbi:MAG: DUF979 domain-containing protein [Gammaproteobacteria bacterium]|jgi:uncharacterized membrane protein|nr:DUF979 domain-containing protein [Gammaproteobacteria bacterium]MBU2180681.1 DUF979 domain-containing protein [Gammaproteobacteria bacterium]MBU2224432.1 DUF979 domain-containing protein [Gammaproteobacteria bacterium]MBU2277500.1 DUF979 domain-containing protein [Gammaproteobacteria bacterium]